MTITNPVASVTISGNGAQTVFTYNFLIPYQIGTGTPAVKVSVINIDGTETVLGSGAFSISGVANNAGGTVTYPLSGSPIPAGAFIKITRALVLIQPTAFPNNAFYPKAVENALDFQSLALQQIFAETSYAEAVAIQARSDIYAEKNRAISTENNIVANVTTLAGQLSDEIGARTTADAQETTARLAAEAILRNSIIVASNFIDVRSYGAAFNGTTDDTVAWGLAITAAQTLGRDIVLPQGTTVVTSISIPAGVRVIGQPGRTTIYAKRQVYADYSPIIYLGGDGAELIDVNTDLNDAIFDAHYVRHIVLGNVTAPALTRVVTFGRGQSHIIAYQCINPRIIGCRSNTQGTSVFRPVQVTGCTGGVIDDLVVTGTSTAHAFIIENSTAVFASNIRSTVRTLGGFGISLVNSINCQVTATDVSETQFESHQMTSCTSCVMSNIRGSWTGTNGQDFGFSWDACVKCSITNVHMENSYKAAIGIAADSGDCYGNVASQIVAINCAVRATAAVGSLPIDTAAVVFYNQPGTKTYSNTVENVVVSNTIGNTIGYGVAEFSSPAGSTNTGKNCARFVRFTGPGVVTTLYSVNSDCLVWSEDYETWTPTITPQSGSFGAAPTFTFARFKRDGLSVDWQIVVTIPNNGTAAGSVTITPPTVVGYGIYYGAGREITTTGLGLNVETSFGQIVVRTSSNTYPGGTGYQLAVSGRYSRV